MEFRLLQLTVKDYVGDRDQQQLFSGHGAATLQSGAQYEGDWLAGKMHGAGQLQFPDGIQYTGDMQQNTITGAGVFHWPEGSYEGEVVDGKRHGEGVMRIAESDSVYEGSWWRGQRYGKGVLYFDQHRSAFYDGDWEADQKQGHGTMVYPSGNTYTGGWQADVKSGQGVMSWGDSSQVYSGAWAGNKQEGLGQHHWLDTHLLSGGGAATHVMCNRFLGLFQEGRRHGEGALFTSTGARYEGEWRNDRKQGPGVYLFEDGTLFLGRFDQDRPLLDHGCFVTATGVEPALAASTAALAAEASTAAAAAAAAHAAAQAAAAAAAAAAGSTGSAGQGAGKGAKGRLGSGTGRDSNGGNSTGGSRASSAAVAATTKGGSVASTTKGGSVSATTKGGSVADTSKGGSAATTPPGTAPPADEVAAAGASAAAAGAAAAQADAAKTSSKAFVSSAPGFGPRQTSLQLYIGDILRRETSPAVSGKQVTNLLVGYNTQLRLLYDKYRQQPSLFLEASGYSPSAHITVETAVTHPGVTSRALRAAHVWMLAADAGLVSRYLTLQQVDQAIVAAVRPPPVMLLRRQQVSQTAAAPAVLQDAAPPHDPTRDILYRDFCELLVRLAALRYPREPTLEQRLQLLLNQHLMPLVPTTSAGGRLSAAGAAAAPGAMFGHRRLGSQVPSSLQVQGAGPELPQDAADLLLQYWVLLEQLFGLVVLPELGSGCRDAAEQPYWRQEAARFKQQVEALLGAGCWTSYPRTDPAPNPAAVAQDQAGGAGAAGADAASGSSSSSASGGSSVYASLTTSRRLLEVWAQAGLVPAQVGHLELLQALLDPIMNTIEPEQPRLRMDADIPPEVDPDSEPAHHVPEVDSLADTEAGGAPAEDGTSSAAATEQPACNPPADLLFWADAPMTFADFVLGLVRVSKVVAAKEAAAAAAAAAATAAAATVDSTAEEAGAEELEEDAGAAGAEEAQIPAAAAEEEQVQAEGSGAGPAEITALQALQLLLLGDTGLFKALLGWQPPAPTPPPQELEEGASATAAAAEGDQASHHLAEQQYSEYDS